MASPLIVTHCGAGSTPDVLDGAERAGQAALGILERRGKAIDAVIASIVVLEDDPRLNAGTGSRMRVDGQIQMDAAIMTDDLECGAVAAIEKVKNPILVARKVMETPHILLVGSHATRFARRHGFPAYNPATPGSRERLQESLRRIRSGDLPPYARKWRLQRGVLGTVGAVARDRRGRFCAGNSTGGTAFMMPGRVGDTPLIGSGIYCGPVGAVSATGIGEEIVKRVLSKFVYDRIEDHGNVQRAVDEGVRLFKRTVSVGVIAVGARGAGAASNRLMARWTNARSRTFDRMV